MIAIQNITNEKWFKITWFILKWTFIIAAALALLWIAIYLIFLYCGAVIIGRLLK